MFLALECFKTIKWAQGQHEITNDNKKSQNSINYFIKNYEYDYKIFELTQHYLE